jgi:hypothetical protein
MPKKAFTAPKPCQCCGIFYNRKMRPSGVLEGVKEFEASQFCSVKCWHKTNVGNRHALYKPEGSARADGYVRLAVTGRRVYAHRQAMEIKLGRQICRHEHVHHIDGNTGNNAPENLELLTNSQHRKLHCKTAPKNAIGQFTK